MLSKKQRLKILIRDHGRCRKCHKDVIDNEDFEIHHCVPVGAGGENALQNLIILCVGCHKKAPHPYGQFEDTYSFVCTTLFDISPGEFLKIKDSELYRDNFKRTLRKDLGAFLFKQWIKR